MTKTDTLKFFYIISGLIFQNPTLGILIRNFLKAFASCSLIYAGMFYFCRFKIQSLIAIILGIFIAFKLISLETFIFLPVLLFILFCLNFKKSSSDIILFSGAVLLVSLKVFWATAINSYGIFFIPVLIIAVLCFLNKEYYKTAIVYLLILTIGFAYFNYKEGKNKIIPVTSERGVIYTYPVYDKTAQELVNYILKNTNKEDKILILPEGLFFNFLTNRNSEDYYNSYLPLYIETFGESRLIKNIEQNKPDYIFIHNFPTSDYYFKSICKDYGFNVCNFINKEYSPKSLLLGDFTVYVFEQK